MDNKLINAVIQLTSKEEKTGKFGPMAKTKDEKGLTYTVYKTKKDGTVSVAWDQLQALSVGDMVQAGFAEEIVEHPEHGKYTARTIRSFNSDIGNGVANSQAQAKSSNLGHSGASGGVLKDDAFWEKQAHEKCCSLWTAALMQRGTLAVPNFDEFWTIFQAIKADGNKRFSPLRQAVQKHAPAVMDEDLPVIQQDEDVDDIPF